MDDNILSIQKKLSKRLNKERYNHTLGVAYTASSLAMKYGEDIKTAFLAGLLHDCAKAYKSSKYLQMAKDYSVSVTESEEENPSLLHAKLGACLAKNVYGIFDENILNSIIYHTTGRPDMSVLEKIIYIADYIEPGRYKQKRLKEIRETAFNNLDQCMVMILEDTIEHLKTKTNAIDPNTELTYNFYLEAIK